MVSAVFGDGEPLTLVEDTRTTDGAGSAPESLRTWSSTSGAEVKTATSPAGARSGQPLAERVTDALSGAVMERLMSVGASREDIAVAVARARAVGVQDEAVCLLVDGEPHEGISASSEGILVRGVHVGDSVVVVIAAADSAPVTLGALLGA